MIWWYWILLGLALAAIELATPGGFFVIFFAVGALLVGLIERRRDSRGGLRPVGALHRGLPRLAGALPQAAAPADESRASTSDAVDSLVGELAIAAEAIPPGEHGRAELRGSTWTARNVGAAADGGR